MNPHPLFCPNPSCPSRGIEQAHNIRPHDTLRDRWRCTTCGKTFSGRQGTPFHRLKTDEKTVVLVLSLLAFGCPLQAIVQAFGFDERTVRSWQDRAGRHCERVHEALVGAQPMELGQVQADEVRVRLQGRMVAWMAMAICVPTRLWLGGVVQSTRDKGLIRCLATKVKACARFGPLLLLSDGLSSYIAAWRSAFRTPEHTGKRGRPKMLAWPGVVIGQVVKQYRRGRVVDVEQRLVQGSIEQLLPLLSEEKKINTAYIERLNATFRARLCPLTRRTRALARQPETLSAGMHLIGCLYNFCTPHRSLSALCLGASAMLNRTGKPDDQGQQGQQGQDGERTPAMAAGLTNHVWTVSELLLYRVAPTPWIPLPSGRRSRRRPKEQEAAMSTSQQLVTV